MRIVIELNSGANFHVRICRTQFVDFVEIDAGVVTVVIGKRDIRKSFRTRAIDPGLEQFLRIRLNSVALRMGMVVAEELMADS